MASRYCTNCGHEFAPEDRFCIKCGKPVQATAQVSEQKANFSTSSPHWQQPRAEAPPSRGIRAPLLVLVGVFLVTGFVDFLNAMVNGPRHEVGYVLGYGVGQTISSMLILAMFTLIAGSAVYLFYRFRRGGTTFVRAQFSWPVVVIVTCLALSHLVATT
jgi:hypothetical protein